MLIMLLAETLAEFETAGWIRSANPSLGLWLGKDDLHLGMTVFSAAELQGF